jgi:hypothetical protein
MYQEREIEFGRGKRGESKKCDRVKVCERYTVTKKQKQRKKFRQIEIKK